MTVWTENNDQQFPSTREITNELSRVRYRERYRKIVRNTFFTLIVVAAVAVLISMLWLPVLRIYGNSMVPTLEGGDIVLAVKDKEFQIGDIIAFYYNNKILIKRAIAQAGEWVDIDKDGTVYVTGDPIDEPYIDEKALGDCNIELPFQVPEDKVFVMGDNRDSSVDSRNTAVGCIAEEQVVGKLIFVVWPFAGMRKL